ncbi:hypothetical protein QUF55_06150 [Clostridiaceae bacterium HSG29]|nr:hypothetical protein [Clostridiaceae bacterium HSG29]
MNDREFEKNRQQILKNVKLNKGNNQNNVNKEKLWKYEILKYRKQKRIERFFMIGSIAGILSLVINLILNYSKIIDLLTSLAR